MMSGMARLGRDAEVRTTASGDQVCTLALAFTYGKRDSEGKYPTQWVDAALWGQRAAALAPFLTKGSQHVFHLSDLHMETYEGNNGTGHKLVARVVDVELGPRAAQSNQGYGDSDHQPQRRAPAPRSAQPPAAPPRAPAPPKASGFDDMDRDIPF